MEQLVRHLFQSFSRAFQRKTYNKFLTNMTRNTSEYNKTSEKEINDILKQRFPDAKSIEVEDTSGGCGAMYKIYIETHDFKGLSIPNQHKAVYAALKEQIKVIHGLHVFTKVAEK